jgi:hypothetical protein
MYVICRGWKQVRYHPRRKERKRTPVDMHAFFLSSHGISPIATTIVDRIVIVVVVGSAAATAIF